MTYNFEEVSTLEANELNSWVKLALTNESKVVSGFNWLGLAETLAFNVRQNENAIERLQRAELAVTIYEWLAEYENPHEDAYLNSANSLRVYLLSNNFVDFLHPILGFKGVERWLWNEIDISPKDALLVSKIFRDRIEKGQTEFSGSELGNIKLIRKIKNRLQIIKSLSHIDNMEGVLGKISDWLEIADDLL